MCPNLQRIHWGQSEICKKGGNYAQKVKIKDKEEVSVAKKQQKQKCSNEQQNTAKAAKISKKN